MPSAPLPAVALTLRRDPDRGMMTITVELPLETGELVDKALDRADGTRTASLIPSSRKKAGRRSKRMRWWRWRRAYLGGEREGARTARRIITR